MTTAILDTNVVVQGVISDRGASHAALQLALDGRCQLVFSSDTLNELERVLAQPSIVALHGWTSSEIEDLLTLLAVQSVLFAGNLPVSPEITRDATDAKFLALSEEAAADYLVTNDRRHLLPLRRFGTTRIVTPATFVREAS